MFLLILYWHQERRRDERNGHGRHMFNLHHHAPVLLDPFDHTFPTGEITLNHLDALTWFPDKLKVFYENTRSSATDATRMKFSICLSGTVITSCPIN